MRKQRSAGPESLLKSRLAGASTATALIAGIFPDGPAHLLFFAAAVVSALLLADRVVSGGRLVSAVFGFVLAVFLPVAFAAALNPPTTEYGSTKIRLFLTLTAAFASFAALLDSESAVRYFARTWVALSTVIGFLALVGFEGERSSVFGSNPIWSGRVMAVGIVLAAWLYLDGTATARWLVPSTMILAGGLLTAGSRGPLVGLGVGLLVVVLFTTREKVRTVVPLALLLFLAVLGLLQTDLFRDSRIHGALQGEVDNADREGLWSAAITIAARAPWGIGAGNYATEARTGADAYPHNLFLEVVVEFGWVLGAGLTILVALTAAALMRRRRFHYCNSIALALLSTQVVFVSVSGDMNASDFFFALAWATALAWTQRPSPDKSGQRALGQLASGCPRGTSGATRERSRC